MLSIIHACHHSSAVRQKWLWAVIVQPGYVLAVLQPQIFFWLVSQFLCTGDYLSFSHKECAHFIMMLLNEYLSHNPMVKLCHAKHSSSETPELLGLQDLMQAVAFFLLQCTFFMWFQGERKLI